MLSELAICRSGDNGVNLCDDVVLGRDDDDEPNFTIYIIIKNTFIVNKDIICMYQLYSVGNPSNQMDCVETLRHMSSVF